MPHAKWLYLGQSDYCMCAFCRGRPRAVCGTVQDQGHSPSPREIASGSIGSEPLLEHPGLSSEAPAVEIHRLGEVVWLAVHPHQISSHSADIISFWPAVVIDTHLDIIKRGGDFQRLCQVPVYCVHLLATSEIVRARSVDLIPFHAYRPRISIISGSGLL